MSISYGTIAQGAAAFGGTDEHVHESAWVEFRRPPPTPFEPLDLDDPIAREPILPEQKPSWYAYY